MSDGDGTVTREHVARGVGFATLARLGAVVEVVAQPVYTWLFGIATYGVYTVLWAVVNVVENIVDLGMTQALQRVVPGGDEARRHAAVKFALLATVIPAALIALASTLCAGPIAALISAAPEDRATLPLAVAMFAWTLPLWTFVEVATSAVRARRAFGPEIRLRIFWEQIARLIFAAALFVIGMGGLGLMLAHLLSLTMTAILSVRLLGRYYSLKLLLRVPVGRGLRSELLASGLALLPTTFGRRLFIDLPPVILNLMLPGAAGATAAGLFGIARKIATIPLIVRQAFQYVLAPLASAQANHDRSGIAPLYRFASHVSNALVIPIAGFLILAAGEILGLFAPEAMAALPLLVILVLGRAGESLVGPAQPVVEMVGHRGLPLLNSLLGLGAWAVLSWLLVPTMGGTGMAIAVSIGTIVTAWAAAIELGISDGLSAWDGRLLAGVATTLVGLGAMALVGELLDPGGAKVRAAGLLLLLPAVMWLALRTGLDRDDRLALGKAARTLRLI